MARQGLRLQRADSRRVDDLPRWHFQATPKSIAIRRVNSSRPPPAKSREKPARLGRRGRGLPLVGRSNHLGGRAALPPIRGEASCPIFKAFRPPFHSLPLRAPLGRSATPG